MKKLTVVIFLASLIVQVHASNAKEVLQQATDLLNHGEPEKALQLLQMGYEAQTATNQELFLLGMSAKKSGNDADAIMYFEQLLTRDSNATRVKLELAETVFQQGDSQYARSLLVDAKNNNPPSNVLQNINKFIYQIDNPNSGLSNKTVQWQAWGELGFMVDSNANAAPIVDSVTMYNVPFILSDDAKETSDTVKLANLGIANSIHISNKASWQTRLSAHWQDYNKLSQLDSLQLNFQTGPYLALSQKTSLNFPVTTNRVKVGHGQSYYYYSYGTSPRLSYQASSNLHLSSSLTLAKRKYKSNNKPDITMLSFSPSVQYRVSDNNIVGGGVTFSREKSNNAFDSSRSTGAFANYQHHFGHDIFASLSLGYKNQAYDAMEAAFSQIRKDNLFNAGISATKHIKAIDANLSLSLSYSKNNSNLPLYDYKRTQAYFSINKQF